MKGILLGLSVLVLALSGVAAVSAYEAHLINVTAHVENAMTVDTGAIDFGTVFPQEWFIRDFHVTVSDSFCELDQDRVSKIDYSIWVEWKPNPVGGYYLWLGDALYVGIEATNKWPSTVPGNPGDLYPVGAPPAGPPGAKYVMSSTIPLNKVDPWNFSDTITVGIDVPVFEGYYNALTDPEPKPSGLYDPTVIIPMGSPRWNPDGIYLGTDLKIQVTNIYN